MGYFDDVWSNLVLNAGSATSQLVNSLNWRLARMDRNIKYVSQSAYKSVLVHTARQLAMSTLEGELNSLYSKYEIYARNKMLEAAREKQMANRAVLIKNGEKSTEGFGFIECQGGHKLIAKTKYGTPVPEALILSYVGDEDIHYTDVLWDETSKESHTVRKKKTLEKLWNPGNEIENTYRERKDDSFDTKTVFHIDLSPRVSVNSAKNIVLTTVQGRDYSRKELVSGGDLTYSVSGNIISDQDGVYPTEAVKRFVKIMQHNDVIDVNYITFGVLGVKKIIIKDFSLGAPEYKNVQPYTFSCVGVEPDDAIKLNNDTIATLNEELSGSQWDSWYKNILDNKLAQMAAKKVLSVGTSAVTSTIGTGLDELLPNI